MRVPRAANTVYVTKDDLSHIIFYNTSLGRRSLDELNNPHGSVYGRSEAEVAREAKEAADREFATEFYEFFCLEGNMWGPGGGPGAPLPGAGPVRRGSGGGGMARRAGRGGGGGRGTPETEGGGKAGRQSGAPKGKVTPEEAAAIAKLKEKEPSGTTGYTDNLGFPVRHGGRPPSEGHLAKQAEVANKLIKEHGLTSENGLVLYNKSLRPANDPFASGNNKIKPDVQVFEKTPNGWRRVGKPVEIERKGDTKAFKDKEQLYKDNNGGSFEPVEY
jgi:hypothetical protein